MPIGLWVLHEACRRAKAWPEHLGIAVNVSPVQFRHPVFCQAVIDLVQEIGLAPSRLELEVTEGVMLQNTEMTLATLRRLQAFGIRLAMDDFGTGYSSLGYLQKFRFDKIKIDRSFTARVDEDPHAEAIVRAVIDMSESLGVSVNAEGVESNVQAEVLRALGCAEGQGFLYSRPVPAEVFDALVRQNEVTERNPPGLPDPAESPALVVASAAGGRVTAVADADGPVWHQVFVPNEMRQVFRPAWQSSRGYPVGCAATAMAENGRGRCVHVMARLVRAMTV